MTVFKVNNSVGDCVNVNADDCVDDCVNANDSVDVLMYWVDALVCK
jgi:hypothetical protein